MVSNSNKLNLFWVPIFLILYNFFANLANDIYLPSMPTLARVFSTSSNTLQMTMTSWFAGVALPQFFFGPLTDRFGRRPILLLGGICFIISTLVCACAGNVWLLIIARFFQGVGVCSLNVSTFAILSDLFDYRSRIQITNKISMCGTIAPLAGPILGGYLLTFFGWRSNFYLILIGGIVCVVGLSLKLPESNLYLNPHALYVRNLFKNYYLLVKQKGFLKHLIPYCLLLGGLVAYLTSAPFIIINKLGISPEYFGYTQLPIFATYILGSLYINRIDDDEKIRLLSTVGIKIVLSAGVFLVLASYFWGNNLYAFITPMVIYALGLSLCSSHLMNAVISSTTLTKGSAAAFLGFGMAASCMTSSFFVSLIYNGHILSIAVLLFTITAIASGIYLIGFTAPEGELERSD